MVLLRSIFLCFHGPKIIDLWISGFWCNSCSKTLPQKVCQNLAGQAVHYLWHVWPWGCDRSRPIVLDVTLVWLDGHASSCCRGRWGIHRNPIRSLAPISGGNGIRTRACRRIEWIPATAHWWLLKKLLKEWHLTAWPFTNHWKNY